MAARLARGDPVPGGAVDPAARIRPGWPEDLARIVYVDRFGNAITGLRATALGPATVIAGVVTAILYAFLGGIRHGPFLPIAALSATAGALTSLVPIRR